MASSSLPFLALLLLAALPGLRAAVTLLESGGDLQPPGGSLRLLCHAPGIDLGQSRIFWVRQGAGRRLELLAGIGGPAAPWARGRFRVGREGDGGGSVTLSADDLRDGDSGAYFCAAHGGAGAGDGRRKTSGRSPGFLRGFPAGPAHRGSPIDAWGSGTTVTVSSGSARAPDLFPLSPCGSGTAFSVGCVAVGFTPPPVGFAWRDRENRSAPGAAIFPPVRSSGRFLAASRLGMELEEGKGRQPFWCRAEHARGSRSVQVYNPGPGSLLPPVTLLTLHPPSREEFQGPYRNSTLLCRIRGSRPRPGHAPILWLRNGAPLSDGATPEAPAVEGPGIFVTGSRLVVTEAEWERGDVFTCQAGEESRNTSKAMECGYDQPLSASDIRVETVAPLFADIFRDQAARLTCRVSNLAAGGEGLEVTWLNEEGEALATKMAAPALQPNGLLAAEGVATVSVEAWESGQVFTCRVTHPELLFPREVTMRKSTVPDAAPPTVHLLAPPPEQLRRRTWATLTCLILDFNPPDLLVQWLKDGQPLPSSHALTWKPRPQPSHAPSGHAHQSVSTLTVPARDWEGGHVYTCLVGHERLPLRLAQKSLDKSAGNPAHLNVSLVLSDSAAACY